MRPDTDVATLMEVSLVQILTSVQESFESYLKFQIEKTFDELVKKIHTIVIPTIPVRIPMELSTATKIGHGFQTYNSVLGLVKP